MFQDPPPNRLGIPWLSRVACNSGLPFSLRRESVECLPTKREALLEHILVILALEQEEILSDESVNIADSHGTQQPLKAGVFLFPCYAHQY